LVKIAEAFDAEVNIDVVQAVVRTTAVIFDIFIGRVSQRIFVELGISVMFVAAAGVAATCVSLLLSAASL
jgi:hypothetical protein